MSISTLSGSEYRLLFCSFRFLGLRFLLVVFVSCILSVCLSVSVCCVVDEIKIVIKNSFED